MHLFAHKTRSEGIRRSTVTALHGRTGISRLSGMAPPCCSRGNLMRRARCLSVCATSPRKMCIGSRVA